MQLISSQSCVTSARERRSAHESTKSTTPCCHRAKCSRRPTHVCSKRDNADAEQLFTFFTSDGLVQWPARRPVDFQTQRPPAQPLPTWQEQGLCVAATFWVAATNGTNPARRLQVAGFCRSLEMLSEHVENSVVRRGGEVMRCESRVSSSLSETLQMVVVLPFLWGVPPEHENLRHAIEAGGGIVDRVSREWHWYR